MNKKNLIVLGALCQKMFNLPNFFNVIELPSDFSQNIYRLANPEPTQWGIGEEAYPSSSPKIEDIELVKLGISNNYETMRVGYSERNNTLVIKE